jgi:agmatinase
MADWRPPLDSSSWKAYAQDPLPGWARRSGTLFDVEPANLAAPRPCDVAICSVPWDTTASTRIGARTGPAAIREASIAYSAQANSRGGTELLNLRTGRLLRPRQRHLTDFGDLHTYPSDTERQLRATAAEVFAIGLLAEQVIALGGEHTVSHPLYGGLQRAWQAKRPGSRLGYVQIDHHFDFGDRSALHGRHYHGSNGRRISELEGVQPEAMGFVGMGDLTSAAQLAGMRDRGITVRTMMDVRDRGFSACLSDACKQVLKACDTLYVSIDIDVCDLSVSPGTGHVTVGGIGAVDFLAIADVLRPLPVFGLDIVEVNGLLDPSGTTAHLAARLLFELLLLEESGQHTHGQPG